MGFMRVVWLCVFSFVLFSTSMNTANAYRNDDRYVIAQCRIVELLKRGQNESNNYVIRGLSRRGKVLETFRAFDGRPFQGRAEAEMGLFLLVEEGSCPP